MRDGGARERAPGARGDQLGDVGAGQRPVSCGCRDARADGTWSGRPHYLVRMVIEGVHLFQGIDRRDDGPRRGLAVPAGRPLPRARRRHRGAPRSALREEPGASAARRQPDHVEWVGLLRSCSALEAYCRCYTADLRPERIAEFLLLNAEFPRSVRFAAARVESALRAIAQLTARGAGGRAERLAGRLHASLDYGQVDEILSDDPHAYLEGIGRHCAQIHAALYQTYIGYPIESALPA